MSSGIHGIGVKRVLEHEIADAKANALRSKKKKKLVEQGSKVFGSLDDILFQNKVRKRLGKGLPAALRNFGWVVWGLSWVKAAWLIPP